MSSSQTLAHLLQERINFTQPLSRSLQTLDSLLKQLKISHTSPQALSAYELICQQYLSPSIPQVLRLQSSPRRSHSTDIADPEAFTHFSFAKKPRPQAKKSLNKMKPQQLFSQDSPSQVQQLRSEEVPMSRKISHSQHKYALTPFQLPKSDLQESRHSLEELKQVSRQKMQDLAGKETLLQQQLKRKYMKELIKYVTIQKNAIRKQLKSKAAKFLLMSRLLNKGFSSLAAQRTYFQQLLKKADDFSRKNDEIILEDYFLAWKQRTNMTEVERNFEAEVHRKYEHLGKVRVFRQLQALHKWKQNIKGVSEEQSKIVLAHLQKAKKVRLFQNIGAFIQYHRQTRDKTQKLCFNRKARQLKQLQSTISKLQIFRNIKQNSRIDHLHKQLYGSKLLRRIKIDLQLKKAYWKHPEKMIFVQMIMQGVRDSLVRKGYNHLWMQELPQCIEKTDSQLNYVSRRWRLRRLFSALRNQLEQQKQKMQAVRMIHGKMVIKQILANYRDSILNQKSQIQVQHLENFLADTRAYKFLSVLKENKDESLKRKSETLIKKLKTSRVSDSLKYMAAYRMASNYYSQRIAFFNDKMKQNLVSSVWKGFKQVVLTEIINKNIVSEYLQYTRLSRLGVLFAGIKAYTFAEKIMHKRTDALRKLRVRSYFETLTFNMRISLFGRHKLRQKQFKLKENELTETIIRNKIIDFLSACRRQKFRKQITNQVSQQYNYRFAWKSFQCWKLITFSRKQQKMKAKEISRKKEISAKKHGLDRLVNALLMSLHISNCERIARIYLNRTTFDAIKTTERIQPIDEETEKDIAQNEQSFSP